MEDCLAEGSSRCITWSHCVAVGQSRCSHAFLSAIEKCSLNPLSFDCIRLSFFFALFGSSLFLQHLIHCQESSHHTKVKYEVFPQNVRTSLEGHQLISTFPFIVAFPRNSQHWTPHCQECHLQTHDTKPNGSSNIFKPVTHVVQVFPHELTSLHWVVVQSKKKCHSN